MQNQILDKISKSQQVKPRPDFRIGDRLSVSVRLKEGDKERVQVFRGVVIAKSPKSGKGVGATFTVRKVTDGVGVERVFALHSPFIEDIQVETSAFIRRSRLYYLRDLKGKKARLKEKGRFEDIVAEGTEKRLEQEVSTISTQEVSASENNTEAGTEAK